MAGMGPPPAANKRRRNADTFDQATVTVAADKSLKGPALPSPGRGKAYSKQTKDWYATWRRAPQAAMFTNTDWQRLAMLAPIVDAYYRTPDTKLLSEIRLNESLLGATHVDRMRGRIAIAEKPTSASVPQGDELEERRRRLTDAS